MLPLQSRFQKSLVHSGCIPTGSRVLVAVSGGADSVALLSLLHHVADRLQLTLKVAHLDHALRESSHEDARFVRRLCHDLGLPLTIERIDVAELSRQRRGNLEEVAREVRRDFLASTALAADCQLIALGHHADDQAETFLMRLLRGSGTAGLAGMCLVSDMLVRPLLPFRRSELLEYLKQRGLAWREDESNLDTCFTRNRIRHQLMPLLESFNPNVSTQITVLCDQLQQDNAFWGGFVDQAMAGCCSLDDGIVFLDRQGLLELPEALAGRVVRSALRQARGTLRGFASIHIRDILQLAREGPAQGELSLPGVWVARRYEQIQLHQEKPAADAFQELELPGPGSYRLADGRHLSVSLVGRAEGESAEAAEFSAAELTFPLRVRPWSPGDRIRPSGMVGHKKLHDLFVDLKLPREDRRKTLLLVKDDEIVWVLGLRRAEGRWPEPGEDVVRFVIEPEKGGIIVLR